MITHECSRRNITVKQSERERNKLILQFETFAKASQVADFLSGNDSISFYYHHNPAVEKYDAEIAVRFKRENAILFTLFRNYLGINLWEILPDEVAPYSDPLNSNS